MLRLRVGEQNVSKLPGKSLRAIRARTSLIPFMECRQSQVICTCGQEFRSWLVVGVRLCTALDLHKSKYLGVS